MNILLLILLGIALFIYGSEMTQPAAELAGDSPQEIPQMSAVVVSPSQDTAVSPTSPSASENAAVLTPPTMADDEAQPAHPPAVPSRGPGAVLFDFSGQEPAWNIINDTVMGGMSQSSVRVDPSAQSLLFSGAVSLENNGGFASARSEWTAYDLSSYSGIALRVRGDGGIYRFRIRSAETGPGIAYTGLFQTEKDAWQELYIPFAEMIPLYRGYVVNEAGPLDAASIRSFGLMVSDKQEGQFSLEVDWINAVAESSYDVSYVSMKAG